MIVNGGLKVIDVGAGMGQIAQRIARLGNDVTLCEPSHEMLGKARESFKLASLTNNAKFVQSTIQNLLTEMDEQCDVIICHAVLEWLADPRGTLGGMVKLMKPDSYLFLMFYNANAAILKRVLRGAPLEALIGPSIHQAPIPFDPGIVRSWLKRCGLTVQSKSGIRIFYDHLSDQLKVPPGLEELLMIETEFRSREPFASLGQHIHFVCRRI